MANYTSPHESSEKPDPGIYPLATWANTIRDPLPADRRTELTVDFPGVIWFDHRETAPYAFTGFIADIPEVGPAWVRVPVKVTTLETGDYTLGDDTGPVAAVRLAIERKSREDMLGTLVSRRKAFEREVCRLGMLTNGGVLVECPRDVLFQAPLPIPTRMKPAVLAGIWAGIQRWNPKVQVVYTADRRQAELWLMRALADYLARAIQALVSS